jgi:hypothetical protein
MAMVIEYDSMEPIDIDLDWGLDDDGTQYAEAVLGYEIDLDNLLSVYRTNKLVAERQAVGIAHAEYLAEAFERTAIWYKRLEDANMPLPAEVF